MSKPSEFTDTNFQSQVLDSDQPVLVDFWAAWCGPCRALGPVVEQLSEDLGADAKVGKLNVDENRTTAAAFGIQALPSVLIFRNGEVVDRLVGVQPAHRYKEALELAAA